MPRPAPKTEAEIAERNAEARAQGNYARFLLRRYQRLDLAEMVAKMEAAEPISLRQVFVPVRLGAEDLADETFGDKQKLEDEKLPGTDAWEVLGDNDWVMLAGRPGSGKTTLVQAVVMELCSERPSTLRDKLRALPVPLILRDLGELSGVKTLEALFERFWEKVLPQATVDGFMLDRVRLENTLLAPATFERPTLLLFDGIDEIGSKKTRQQLLEIARGARDAGYRVLVTGRPDGYRDLDLQSVGGKPSFMLPFAWSQIQLFIDRWYRLRDEWEAKRADGVRRFLEQIGHKDRRNLLVLARRPIFLTLMAMVNCTENEMPAGRASLYSKIVDLYLERQRKHRRLQFQLSGDPFKDWPEHEVRLVLAHLAWRSQQKGAESPQAFEAEYRRVVWARHEVIAEIRGQIEGGKQGRFTVLEGNDAEKLVDFFLHPAGLLVEPGTGRVQFAHLSFQEYLCAYFLHERFKLEGDRYLRAQLWKQLKWPGWREVGLLFLYIHSEATNHEGHFKLLTGLDLKDIEQGSLYVAALTGKELSFEHQERLELLPVALALALLNPAWGFGRALGRFEDWRQECRATVLELFKVHELEEVWDLLAPADARVAKLRARWLKPEDGQTWEVHWGAEEARTNTLLELAIQVGFFLTRNDVRNPIADGEFEVLLAQWLTRRLAKEGSRLFWQPRNHEALPTAVPEATPSGLALDVLLPCEGPVFAELEANLPAEVLVLQGEAVDPDGFLDLNSQPSVLAVFQTKNHTSPRIRFALSLYERVLRIEFAAEGREFYSQDTLRLQSQSQLRSRSQLQLQSRLRSQSRSRSLLQSRSQSHSLLRSRSQSLSQSNSHSQSLSQLQPRSQSHSLSLSVWRSQSLAQAHALSQSLPFYEAMREQIKAMVDLAEKPQSEIPAVAVIALVAAGYRFAARDYFVEKGENPPQLVERQTYVELGRSLESFEGFFREVFGNEQVKPEVKAILEDDWNTLATRPWSPQAMLAALMKDWPENETVRDVSWEATEKMVAEAVAAGIAELEAKSQAKKK